MNFNEGALGKIIIKILQTGLWPSARRSKSNVITHKYFFFSHLKNSLVGVNPSLKRNTIPEVIYKIKNLDQNNLIRNNQEFSHILHEDVETPEYTDMA